MNRSFPKTVRIIVSLGAWLFAVGTLLQVLGYFIWSWFVPHTYRYCHLWALNLGGRADGPVGLTYRGLPGQLLAGGQAAFVIAALALSLSSRATLGRLGHLALVAWAALWLGNEVWFFTLTPLTITAMRVSLVGALCACTILRAMLNWSPSARAAESLPHP